jgi:hypothetical protein
MQPDTADTADTARHSSAVNTHQTQADTAVQPIDRTVAEKGDNLVGEPVGQEQSNNTHQEQESESMEE